MKYIYICNIYDIYIYYYIYTQLFIYTYIYICILDALVSFLRFFQDKGANSQVSGYFPGFNIPCARCMVYLPPIG